VTKVGTKVGRTTRVGGPPPRDAGERQKTKHENTAKVARRRAHARAEGELQGDFPDTDYLLPNRYMEVDPDIMDHIGVLLAGVQDFKVLRGSIAVLSLATSTEFAHLLTDASFVGRGEHALVIDLWQVRREYVFDEEDEDDDDN